MPLPFEKLRDLTDVEMAAARSYTSESPMLHHVMQFRTQTTPEHCAAGDKVPHLVAAARAYSLTAPITLHTGLGNGYAAVGSLWESDPQSFIGMEYLYSGVFSSSLDPDAALRFLNAFPTYHRVLLTINARPGLLGLPTHVLGLDQGHEGEVLISAGTSFRIDAARRREDDDGFYLHLEISGPKAD